MAIRLFGSDAVDIKSEKALLKEAKVKEVEVIRIIRL